MTLFPTRSTPVLLGAIMFSHVLVPVGGPGAEWVEVHPRWSPATASGGILDRSLNPHRPSPAGAWGPLLVREGRLSWRDRPEEQVRLLGTNLGFDANYPEPADAERIADDIARIGYTLVRFHHHESLMRKADARSSLELDPVAVDRFDHLMAALKARGVAWTTDLYVNRRLSPGEIPGVEGEIQDKDEYKALVAIHPPARENLKAWARLTLSHRNPYTGLTWGEDPAMLILSLVNEGTLQRCWNRGKICTRMFTEGFARWCDEEGVPAADRSHQGPAFARYLLTLERDLAADLGAFVRSLGVRVPLTNMNFLRQPHFALQRRRLEVVDDHLYWDHPTYELDDEGGRASRTFHLRSSIEKGGLTPYRLFTERIEGLPFTVSEYSHVFPNPYRFESVMGGAYAAFQGWDGIYRFNYSHDRVSLTSHGAIYGFDTINDPVAILSDRINALLYGRGDVAEAVGPGFRWVISEEWLASRTKPQEDEVPNQVMRLGLRSRLATRVVAPGTAGSSSGPLLLTTDPALLTAGGYETVDGQLSRRLSAAGRLGGGRLEGALVSDTGQLTIDPSAGRFTAVTPRTVAVVATIPQAIEAGPLRVVCDQPALVAMASVDGHPLDQAARILIVHVTDVRNRGMRFGGAKQSTLPYEPAADGGDGGTWGSDVLEAASGTAELRWHRPGVTTVRAWRCAFDGQRQSELPATVADGAISVHLATAESGRFAGMVYELEVR